MEPSHRRILMDRELLVAAKQGHQSSFARLLGLEVYEKEITINASRGSGIGRCIARDEPDFFLGVTYSGDSLLHLAASSSNFLDLAEKIWRKENSLLMTRNKVLDTPLHCAARNGYLEMVSRFVAFAREMGEGAMEEVTRARNKHGETALHQAARHNQAHVADILIDADPGLAGVVADKTVSPSYLATTTGSTSVHAITQGLSGGLISQSSIAGPEGQTVLHAAVSQSTGVVDGKNVSPVYLATASGSIGVVRAIIRSLSGGLISQSSFAGPEGQTALHAAVLQSTEMTEELLKWQPLLATMPDDRGNTPLHFNASSSRDSWKRHATTVHVLLEHNYSAAYLQDSSGLFPVHVAASMGHVELIKVLLDYCPDSDELVDHKGRNFLHVAAQEGQQHVVSYICPTARWRIRRAAGKHKNMKNARDDEGNTQLHLAINAGKELATKILMEDKEVLLCISNGKGLTPRDLSVIARQQDNAVRPLFKSVNMWLTRSMQVVGAHHYGPRRWDHFIDDHTIKKDVEKENKELMNAIQTIGSGSVLITTATFAALFALPGGYRADDHHHAGTPTLARKYAFKAFLIADTIAFLLAFDSTLLLLFHGVTTSKPHLKLKSTAAALWLMIMASRCMMMAFALACFVVIFPISKFLGILALLSTFWVDEHRRDLNFVHAVVVRRCGRKLYYTNPITIGAILARWMNVYFPFVFVFGLPLIDILVSK